MAMMHGHRAAYYVQAQLDGIDNPLPYRTPYRTRSVPIAQDIKWEVFPRIEQDFHGLGDKPVEFPEIESTYTRGDARDEAARCYRCDAETGSFDYNVRTREDIFVMARAKPEDAALHREVLTKRIQLHETPYDEHHKPALEDLVFLPANLSRLVIDPYRDACRVGVDIADEIELDLPFLVGGFDDAPEEIRNAIGSALEQKGSAYVGSAPLGAGNAPWLQTIINGEGTPDDAAAAHIITFRDGFQPLDLPKQSGKLRGLAVSSADLEDAIPHALDAGFDMLILDATPGIASPWSELAGSPDFTVVRDALHILRRMNREEDIDLIYFGGIRTGTDGAKLVGLGAKASLVGVAMALALGGRIEGGTMVFHGDRTSEERIDATASLLGALSAEASIMARCTGKTNVANLEPEDLRAITIITARQAGVPLAGTQTVPEEVAASAAE